jgi:alpha-beta hydrolase superfamily lysophospholipase
MAITPTQTGTFEGHGSLKLFYRTWQPDTAPKAVVPIIHGAGEHIDRYPHLIRALLAAGYGAAGFDLRGHGRSEGQRGHINSWDEYREDVRQFLDRVRVDFPGLPLFLYAHSLGSLIAMDYILHYPEGLRGAVISGNSLEPTDAAPPHLVLIVRVFSRILPATLLTMPLPGASLSRDPQVAAAYDEDPLVHWQRSLRWGAESLRTIQWIWAHAGQFSLPVLFVHGEADPLVSPQGARRFYEQIASSDKTLNIYPESLHEPHNDLDHAQVTGDIVAWLDERLSGDTNPGKMLS